MAKNTDSCTMSYMVHLITGPTSSGKTEYAVKLAKRLNGEIISVDSRQVYKGMRIGTGAPMLIRGMYKGIKHYLIGCTNPTKPYTVFDFQKDAYRLISEIQKRNKIPIIVGGTGLWIRALKEELDFGQTKPDLRLRKQLEKELKEKGLEYLIKKLKGLRKRGVSLRGSAKQSHVANATTRSPRSLTLPRDDKSFSFGFPDSSALVGMTDDNFDYQNPRRVIRALEILLSPTPSHHPTIPPSNSYRFKTIHLSPPKDVLQKRINKRVDQMIKDGLVKEVRSLLKRYAINKQGVINNPKLKTYPALTGIGYREIIDYLQNKTTLSEAVELIKIHTRQYAKRQVTWFKKFR